MSDGFLRSGQQFDPEEGVLRPFTERMHDYTKQGSPRTTGLEGDPATDINPNDAASAVVRVWDEASIQEQLDETFLEFPDYVDLSNEFPPVLLSIVSAFNVSNGAAESIHAAADMTATVVGAGSIRVDPSSTAQTSAAVIPSVIETYKAIASKRVPTRTFLFYAESPLTLAQVVTRVTALAGATVLAWPKFKPLPITLILDGMRVSVQQSADSQSSVQFSSGSAAITTQFGGGFSTDVDLSTSTVRIPPSLHAALTIASPTGTQTATVNVDASTVAIYDNTGTPTEIVPAIPNTPDPLSYDAVGTISPSSIAATSPTDIPTSGLYIYSIDTQKSAWDRMIVRVVVVDFSYFA